MAQIQTQLLQSIGDWSDVSGPFGAWVRINLADVRMEFDHNTGQQTSASAGTRNGDILSFGDGDSVDTVTGIYTFAEGQPNRFRTPDIGPVPSQDERPWFQTESGVQKLLLTAAELAGTTDQIVVTENADHSITFSLSPNLAFEALHVRGDATVDGALNSASVSTDTVTATGAISTPAEVSAGYLAVDVYEAGQTPPTPHAGKAVFFAQKVA